MPVDPEKGTSIAKTTMYHIIKISMFRSLFQASRRSDADGLTVEIAVVVVAVFTVGFVLYAVFYEGGKWGR